MVADALNRKTQHGLNTIINTQYDLLKGLENVCIELVLPKYIDGILSALEVQPSIIEEIMASQKDETKVESSDKISPKENPLVS